MKDERKRSRATAQAMVLLHTALIETRDALVKVMDDPEDPLTRHEASEVILRYALLADRGLIK